MTELQAARNSWPPWLSKTLTSIKEVANKKDIPFNSINHQSNNASPVAMTHIGIQRRDTLPHRHETYSDLRRESAPVLKDSHSYNNLRHMH